MFGSTKGKLGVYLLLFAILSITVGATPSVEAHNLPENLQPEFLDSVTKEAISSGSSDIYITGIYAVDEYWHTQRLDPASYGLDLERNHVFLLIFTIHSGVLPYDVWDWYGIARLQVDGKEGYAPSNFKIIQPDVHHLAMALEFPKTNARGQAIIHEDTKTIQLILENLEKKDDRQTITWSLPVSVPHVEYGSSTPLAALPVMVGVFAGLAIYLSPCFLEMCGINVALLAGVSGQRANSSRITRKRTLLTSLLFVAGFTTLYTSAGYVAGLGGQIVQDSLFEPISLPLRIGGGIFMIFLALQSFGLTPRIINFYRSPTLLKAAKNIETTKLGGAFVVGLSLGCLQAFRASIVAILLFYSWALGSALNGALMLMTLSLSFGAPFIFLGLFYNRMSFLPRIAPKISRHSPLMMGLLLLLMGTLMIINAEHPILDFIAPIIPKWVSAYV